MNRAELLTMLDRAIVEGNTQLVKTIMAKLLRIQLMERNS